MFLLEMLQCHLWELSPQWELRTIFSDEDTQCFLVDDAGMAQFKAINSVVRLQATYG